MVVPVEVDMTRVFPVVEALPVELEPVLELDLDEQAASPAVSRPAAASAMSLLRRCNLLINLVLLSGLFGCGLCGRRVPISPWPRNELRCGDVQVPAGRAPRVRNLRQGRVLPPAQVISERAPGIERAALRGRAPVQVLRPSGCGGEPLAPAASPKPAAGIFPVPPPR